MIVEIVVVTLITLSSPVVAMDFIRVVELESLKVGKSLNIGLKMISTVESTESLRTRRRTTMLTFSPFLP